MPCDVLQTPPAGVIKQFERSKYPVAPGSITRNQLFENSFQKTESAWDGAARVPMAGALPEPAYRSTREFKDACSQICCLEQFSDKLQLMQWQLVQCFSQCLTRQKVPKHGVRVFVAESSGDSHYVALVSWLPQAGDYEFRANLIRLEVLSSDDKGTTLGFRRLPFHRIAHDGLQSAIPYLFEDQTSPVKTRPDTETDTEIDRQRPNRPGRRGL